MGPLFNIVVICMGVVATIIMTHFAFDMIIRASGGFAKTEPIENRTIVLTWNENITSFGTRTALMTYPIQRIFIQHKWTASSVDWFLLLSPSLHELPPHVNRNPKYNVNLFQGKPFLVRTQIYMAKCRYFECFKVDSVGNYT